MDSLTAHYLAQELSERWSGRRLQYLVLDRDTPAVILAANGSSPVRFDLSMPRVRVHETTASRERGPLEGYLIGNVTSPVDDRRFDIEFERPGKFRGSASRKATLVICVHPRSRGAALSGDAGQRLGAVGARLPDSASPRPVLPGEVVRAAALSGDADALKGGRWTSAQMIDWLLLEADSAADRYEWICSLPPAEPSWCGEILLPLPLCTEPRAAASLIEPASEPRTVEAQRDDRRERAIARMRRELDRAASAPDVRAAADVLIALTPDAQVPARIQLASGARISTGVRPGESAAAAAGRLYNRAASMERALSLLPDRIAELERRGLQTSTVRESRKAEAARDRVPTAALPYRTYRSSGGLEILVGRNARANDELTFKHSSPGDVWLHARGAAGSHVVMRWTRDEPPPARDLEEAAALAAWHSKARGSTLVPVDWTRRRYVRKVRGGRPGAVILSRAETVFARPSAPIERALRDGR